MNSHSAPKRRDRVKRIEIYTRHLVDNDLVHRYHRAFHANAQPFNERLHRNAFENIPFFDAPPARTDRRFATNHIAEHGSTTVLLLVDVSRSNDFGSGNRSKREVMAQIGAVLTCLALRNSDKVRLILFSDIIERILPVSSGKTLHGRIAKAILCHQTRGKHTELSIPLDFLATVNTHRTVAFLISDFLCGDDSNDRLPLFSRKLRVCRQHHDLIAVIVSDPREHELPDCGRITLEDAETGRQVQIDSADPDVRRSWKEKAKVQHDTLRRLFAICAVDSIALSTEHPLIHPLLSFFGTRKRRLAR